MFPRLKSFWQAFWKRETFEQNMEDEFRSHLESRVEDLMRTGLPRQEAERRARIEFGGAERYKDSARESLGIHVADDLWSDFRFAVRSIRKNAPLSAVVVVTLTLGIGLNTGVYTVINAVAFRPRIDKDPASFLHIFATYTEENSRRSSALVPLSDYEALRDGSRTLRALAAWSDVRVPLSPENPTELRSLLVTCNFFSVYTIDRPQLGRLFEPDDCAAARPVILVSDDVWRNYLGADPSVVGKVFYFNQQPVTIVGVTPAVFAGQINGAKVWLPYTLQPALGLGEDLIKSRRIWLSLGGRLKPGISRDQAAAELRLIASQQDKLYPGRRSSISVTDGSWFAVPSMREIGIWTIPLMLGALTCVVLIACANVTTLLLARADARQREIAIRIALGAGRRRLLRMLVTESLLLASVAGTASLGLAYALPDLIRRFIGGGPITEYPLGPDWSVFAYLAAITLLAGCVSGLAPALESLRPELADSLKGRRRLFGGAPSGMRVRSVLVVMQVALSLVLLTGTTLMARANYRAMTTGLGFETRQVLRASISRPRSARGGIAWADLQRAIGEKVQMLAGVQSVAFAGSFPLMGRRIEVQIPGQPNLLPASNVVSPAYFSVLGIPVLRGRAFQESDRQKGAGASPVIVSASLVRVVWPSEDSLGKTIRLHDSQLLEVIGVVRDIAGDRYGEIGGSVLYRPWDPNTGLHTLIVRYAGDGTGLSRAVSAAAREVIPDAIADVKTVEEWMQRDLDGLWKLGVLVAILGGTAMVLTIMGIYGVVSFAVARRMKEMGIRIAIGATGLDIFRAVFLSGTRPVAIGMVVGIVIALPASTVLKRVMERSPFSFDVGDPIAYAAVIILLVAVALAAMIGPARRAAKANPLESLREE